MRILTVDDSKVARSVLRKILGEIGYTDVAEAPELTPLGERLLGRISW